MRKCDTYYSGNASPWETGVSYRALGVRVLGFHIPVVSAFYGGALRALAYARVSREGEDPREPGAGNQGASPRIPSVSPALSPH